MNGGLGDDVLIGGEGTDSFVFEVSSGVDVIEDFDTAAGEVIDLTALGLADDFDGFSASSITEDADGNALIDLGAGNSITLLGVQVDDLQASYFTFV